MNDDHRTLAAIGIGLAALWLWRQQRSQFAAPVDDLTPNATRNSEHMRDLAQTANEGYAPPPPFVISETDPAQARLDSLLNPGSWRMEMPPLTPQ